MKSPKRISSRLKYQLLTILVASTILFAKDIPDEKTVSKSNYMSTITMGVLII